MQERQYKIGNRLHRFRCDNKDAEKFAALSILFDKLLVHNMKKYPNLTHDEAFLMTALNAIEERSKLDDTSRMIIEFADILSTINDYIVKLNHQCTK